MSYDHYDRFGYCRYDKHDITFVAIGGVLIGALLGLTLGILVG